MARVVFNDAVIADSDDIEVVEGNPYFPIESLDRSRLVESQLETVCGWKGTARYWTIEVGDQRAVDAAWYYPDPKPDAAAVAGRVAFYGSKVSIET